MVESLLIRALLNNPTSHLHFQVSDYFPSSCFLDNHHGTTVIVIPDSHSQPEVSSENRTDLIVKPEKIC